MNLEINLLILEPFSLFQGSGLPEWVEGASLYFLTNQNFRASYLLDVRVFRPLFLSRESYFR